MKRTEISSDHQSNNQTQQEKTSSASTGGNIDAKSTAEDREVDSKNKNQHIKNQASPKPIHKQDTKFDPSKHNLNEHDKAEDSDNSCQKSENEDGEDNSHQEIDNEDAEDNSHQESDNEDGEDNSHQESNNEDGEENSHQESDNEDGEDNSHQESDNEDGEDNLHQESDNEDGEEENEDSEAHQESGNESGEPRQNEFSANIMDFLNQILERKHVFNEEKFADYIRRNDFDGMSQMILRWSTENNYEFKKQDLDWFSALYRYCDRKSESDHKFRDAQAPDEYGVFWAHLCYHTIVRHGIYPDQKDAPIFFQMATKDPNFIAENFFEFELVFEGYEKELKQPSFEEREQYFYTVLRWLIASNPRITDDVKCIVTNRILSEFDVESETQLPSRIQELLGRL